MAGALIFLCSLKCCTTSQLKVITADWKSEAYLLDTYILLLLASPASQGGGGMVSKEKEQTSSLPEEWKIKYQEENL